jgi:hypothetical protein
MGASSNATLWMTTCLARYMLLLLPLLARPFLAAVLAQLPSSCSKPVTRRPVPAFRWAGAAAVVRSLISCCVLSRPLHILTPLYWLNRLLPLL